MLPEFSLQFLFIFQLLYQNYYYNASIVFLIFYYILDMYYFEKNLVMLIHHYNEILLLFLYFLQKIFQPDLPSNSLIETMLNFEYSTMFLCFYKLQQKSYYAFFFIITFYYYRIYRFFNYLRSNSFTFFLNNMNLILKYLFLVSLTIFGILNLCWMFQIIQHFCKNSFYSIVILCLCAIF